MKIGHSVDIHEIIEFKNSEIILGNVKIKCNYKIIANSDGDVLIHAIAESIYGALGLGDLGDHFPEYKYKNSGLNSKKILEHASSLLKKNKLEIQNIDALIIFDHAMISPYKLQIKKSLSKILKIDENLINIKATRSEKLHPQHIIAHSVVLIK